MRSPTAPLPPSLTTHPATSHTCYPTCPPLLLISTTHSHRTSAVRRCADVFVARTSSLRVRALRARADHDVADRDTLVTLPHAAVRAFPRPGAAVRSRSTGSAACALAVESSVAVLLCCLPSLLPPAGVRQCPRPGSLAVGPRAWPSRRRAVPLRRRGGRRSRPPPAGARAARVRSPGLRCPCGCRRSRLYSSSGCARARAWAAVVLPSGAARSG